MPTLLDPAPIRLGTPRGSFNGTRVIRPCNSIAQHTGAARGQGQDLGARGRGPGGGIYRQVAHWFATDAVAVLLELGDQGLSRVVDLLGLVLATARARVGSPSRQAGCTSAESNQPRVFGAEFPEGRR